MTDHLTNNVSSVRGLLKSVVDAPQASEILGGRQAEKQAVRIDRSRKVTLSTSRSVDQAEGESSRHRLSAVSGPKLAHGIPEVEYDGAFADFHGLGDLPCGSALFFP